MRKKYIAIIDSGVGGLTVLKKMVKAFPNENYLYLGDNNNAPYGNKTIKELKKITFENLILLNNYKIKFLIVACNTLSTTLSLFIRNLCIYPVYFIYPPVEKFLMEKKNILLLATNLTSKKYKQYKNIFVYPQKNLALEIERNIFNLDKILFFEKNKPIFFNFDLIILGCTHYFFIKNKIFDHFCFKNYLCSEDLLIDNLKSIIKNGKSLVKYKRNEVLFIGKNKVKNKNIWNKVVSKL